MTGGRVLSIREGLGYRPILKLNGFFHRQQPRATVVYGDLLMFPTTLVTTRIPDYIQFMQNFYNQTVVWDQMRHIPDETLQEYIYEMLQANGPREMLETVETAPLTLNAAGYDPLKGFWLDFQDHIPLFRQERWWDDGSNE
jgi:hypothetical protein